MNTPRILLIAAAIVGLGGTLYLHGPNDPT